MKKIDIQMNGQGGIDLITELTPNSDVIISTGDREASRVYWSKLLDAANQAFSEMNKAEKSQH